MYHFVSIFVGSILAVNFLFFYLDNKEYVYMSWHWFHIDSTSLAAHVYQLYTL